MKRFSLRMSDAEYEKISKYAEAKEMSINEVIRELIRKAKMSVSSDTP